MGGLDDIFDSDEETYEEDFEEEEIIDDDDDEEVIEEEIIEEVEEEEEEFEEVVSIIDDILLNEITEDEEDEEEDDDDDDDENNILGGGTKKGRGGMYSKRSKVVRSSTKVLYATEGYTASDCVVTLELKTDPMFANTYHVHVSVGVMDMGHTSCNDEDKNVVGYLKGEIIQRPHPSFRQVALSLSGGPHRPLYECARLYCDSDGIITSQIYENPMMGSTAICINEGGFFHISTTEVRPDYRGMDLGLRMIHETFVFLGDDWNIAVIKPAPLVHPRWKDEDEEEEEDDDLDDDLAPTEEEIRLSMYKHYSRIGFVQGSKDEEDGHLCESFFVTSELYFSPSGLYNNDPINYWISKINMDAQIEVYVPPKREISKSDLDKKLQDCIVNAPSSTAIMASMMNVLTRDMGNNCTAEDVEQVAKQAEIGSKKAVETMKRAMRRASCLPNALQHMKELIDKGASIDNALALHLAAANSERQGISILKAMIHFGGNVNHTDEYGNTPLHMAGSAMAASAVQALLEAGAKRNVTNSSGDTPYQLFLGAMKLRRDETNKKITKADRDKENRIKALLKP